MFKNPGVIRVLFVCLGNICRSPTAEGALRHLLASEAPQLPVEVDSAGTGNYHIGDPPDQRSQRAAKRRGIDLSRLRARQVTVSDFTRFDLILAMDRKSLRDLQALRPKTATARAALFLEYASAAAGLEDFGDTEVPDPYMGGERDFELVLDLVTRGSRRLIEALKHLP